MKGRNTLLHAIASIQDTLFLGIVKICCFCHVLTDIFFCKRFGKCVNFFSVEKTPFGPRHEICGRFVGGDSHPCLDSDDGCVNEVWDREVDVRLQRMAQVPVGVLKVRRGGSRNRNQRNMHTESV